jgi:hypothetical protein
MILEYIQTTRAFPVIPKKKIKVYNEINTTKKGRRVSSGMICSAVVLLVNVGIVVTLIGYSLFPLLKAITKQK